MDSEKRLHARPLSNVTTYNHGIDKMMSRPLTPQANLPLLTMSCQRRMLHYARVVLWARISSLIHRTEETVLAAVP